MTYTEESIPRKVREMALKTGVHTDCMYGDPAEACASCHSLIMLAFDFHYGHLTTPEAVLLAVVDDYLAERVG